MKTLPIAASTVLLTLILRCDAEDERSAASAHVPLYDRAQAIEQLSRTETDRSANAEQLQTFAKELASDTVIRGFGSMGGEEFFSYLKVSESLHRVGGKEWEAWNTKIKAHIEKLQNSDGTWAGQHCITGRVACTSAAVLTTITERIPIQIKDSKEKREDKPEQKWENVPLGDVVDKGIKWLVKTQGNDGGWGQDGGEKSFAREGVSMESEGNDVANTCLATLALARTGSNKDALKKGVDFIIARVEDSPEDGILLKTPQPTQVQRKLGPNIDTFLAALLLAEVDSAMGDKKDDARVRKALEKVIAKIEKSQKDGNWNAAGGWAPILGTCIASQSLFIAQQKGATVSKEVLSKVENWTKDTLQKQK